jgi:serine/threonine protein kinase
VEADARFYIAEISLGLKHLHNNNFVHGDIKLENVLIAKDSHIKLTDLGSASVALGGSEVKRKIQATFSPPEVRHGEGTFGKELDCWQLGFAAFGMLSGSYLPLGTDDVQSLVKQTLSDAGVSPAAQELCQKLLAGNRQERLGFPSGASELQDHTFFETLDWAAIEEKLVEPPFVFKEFPVYGRGRLESSSPKAAASGANRVRGFTWCHAPDQEDCGKV